MARFFLNVRKPDGELVQGNEGTELVQLGRERETATKIAADLMKDDPATASWTIEVVDELHRVVLSEKIGNLAPARP